MKTYPPAANPFFLPPAFALHLPPSTYTKYSSAPVFPRPSPPFWKVTDIWLSLAPIAGEICTIAVTLIHPGRLLATKPAGVRRAYRSLTTSRVAPKSSFIIQVLPDSPPLWPPFCHPQKPSAPAPASGAPSPAICGPRRANADDGK